MNHNEFNILKIVKNLKSIEQQKRGSYHCTKHNKYRISTIISNREATGNFQKKGYIEYTFFKSFNLKQNTKKGSKMGIYHFVYTIYPSFSHFCFVHLQIRTCSLPGIDKYL